MFLNRIIFWKFGVVFSSSRRPGLWVVRIYDAGALSGGHVTARGVIVSRSSSYDGGTITNHNQIWLLIVKNIMYRFLSFGRVLSTVIRRISQKRSVRRKRRALLTKKNALQVQV